MKTSKAYMDATDYTPSPEEAISINWSGRTIADARAAIDVAYAFKAQCGDRTLLPLPGLDYGTAEDQIGIIRLLGSIWTSGYVAGIRLERARRRSYNTQSQPKIQQKVFP